AGTVNISNAIELRVEATGEDTRIGRLMRLVEESAERRAPIVRLADRVAGWFTVSVLLLAGATAAWWWPTSPSAAIEHAVALLIVTCPCALGLATPLAVTVAIGRAARRGILIKGGEVLERLASGRRRHGLVLLDKTGTATEGRLSIVEIAGDPASIRLAATAERRVAHPVARAIVSWCDGTDDETDALPPRVVRHDDVTELEQTLGGGIGATVNGQRVLVGSPAFVGARAIFEPALAAATSQFGANGLTPVAVAVEGRVRAVLGLGDAIRSDASTTLASIRRLGWRVGLLSGDHPAVVARVAAALAIDPTLARGGASPEDKVAAVERAAQDGSVVMVGDGVNDAAALAVATVGVAVHGGAEASLAAADVHLASPGLAPIAELLEGSRRTLRIIRRNLMASLVYNLIAATLAATGAISPLMAAVIMPLSSLTVVGLSLRGRTFRPLRPCVAGGSTSPSSRPLPARH
ncbi:MAG: cation-translocating P-type ATPase, partial [Phycisphaerales bacterium]|nr:cation-translocating P-type ATPase [Phycisphaerales bacterium]